jgi:hypothetical protein
MIDFNKTINFPGDEPHFQYDDGNQGLLTCSAKKINTVLFSNIQNMNFEQGTLNAELRSKYACCHTFIILCSMFLVRYFSLFVLISKALMSVINTILHAKVQVFV